MDEVINISIREGWGWLAVGLMFGTMFGFMLGMKFNE